MTYTEFSEVNSFMTNISEDQKIVSLKVLFYLANIDNKRDELEIKFIKNLANLYQINQSEEIFKASSEEEIIGLLKTINNRRISLELIKEMFLLGHSDSDLTDEETLFIGHAGLAMGIELEKIEQISNWVIDKIILHEQSKIIFEE